MVQLRDEAPVRTATVEMVESVFPSARLVKIR